MFGMQAEQLKAQENAQIRSVLLWQACATFLAMLLSLFFSWAVSGVLFGGVLVILSTWHVHRSVYLASGERMLLLRAAGLRFALFLLLVGLAVLVLEVQPMMLVAGMASAYVALYVRSLLMIFEKLKGS